MANSNWGKGKLPKPVTAPEPNALQLLAFEAEVDQLCECKACFAWQFGDGIQCEKHGYEG